MNVCREAYPPVERGTDESVELSAHPTPRSPLKPTPPIMTKSSPLSLRRRLFPLTSRSSIPLRTTPGCDNVEELCALHESESNTSSRIDENENSTKYTIRVVTLFYCSLFHHVLYYGEIVNCCFAYFTFLITFSFTYLITFSFKVELPSLTIFSPVFYFDFSFVHFLPTLRKVNFKIIHSKSTLIVVFTKNRMFIIKCS